MKIKPGYSHAYLAFLLLFADDIREIINPSISKSEETFRHLYDKVVELVSLQNGLFPVTEAQHGWHQLIDVVMFIKQCGPIREFWAINAERAISKAKDHLQKGGRSYYKTLFRRYVQWEKEESCAFFVNFQEQVSRTNHGGVFTIPIDNYLFVTGLKGDNHTTTFQKLNVFHSEHIIKLQRFQEKEGKYILSYDERQNLLMTLVHEVLKATQYDQFIAMRKSRLCRLWFAIELIKSRKSLSLCRSLDAQNYVVELLEWLSTSDGVEDLRENNLLLDTVDIEDADEALLKQLSDEGCILQSDLEDLDNYLRSFKLFPVYEVAYIKGTKFRGRGSDCCETSLPTRTTEGHKYGGARTYEARLKANDLIHNIFAKLHYSSWFHFRLNPNMPKEPDGQRQIENCAGQFNFFSRVSCSEEPLLDGLPFAAATCRKTSFFEIRFQGEATATKTSIMDINVSEQTRQSLYLLPHSRSPVFFVPLSDVYSNPLAVVPMDIAKTPLTTKSAYKKGECIVQRLLLIGLSPERLSLQYDSQLVKLYNYNKLDSQVEEKTIIANVEEDNTDDTSSDNSS
jgi:hypothetical protein